MPCEFNKYNALYAAGYWFKYLQASCSSVLAVGWKVVCRNMWKIEILACSVDDVQMRWSHYLHARDSHDLSSCEKTGMKILARIENLARDRPSIARPLRDRILGIGQREIDSSQRPTSPHTLFANKTPSTGTWVATSPFWISISYPALLFYGRTYHSSRRSLFYFWLEILDGKA